MARTRNIPCLAGCLAAMLAAAPLSALAADWQAIVSDRSKQVEIDRASVLQTDPGTKVAWGRIVFLKGATEEGYKQVKALNRYDCNRRSFYTIKRVYLDEGMHVLREERVEAQTPISVEPGSVDERLWREVCKPPSPTELAAVVAEADRMAAAARARPDTAATQEAAVGDARATPIPGPEAPQDAGLHGGKGGAAKLEMVSEEHAPAHEAPHEAAAPSAPIIPKPINILPPIDKSKLEHAAEAPAKVVEHPATAVAPTPPAAPARAHAVAVARPVSKPARKVARAAPKEPDPLMLLARAEMAHVPQAVQVHKEVHWSYEGETGPENWARLKPEWAVCGNGKRQSPIDIRDGFGVDLEPIEFDYRPSRFRIVNNGHTIQASLGYGNTMTVMGRHFELLQFHFHRPSEERVDGRASDMVAHLVHRDLDGRLGVVAVLLEVGTTPNPVVQTLWNNLPLEINQEYGPREIIDLRQLLPAAPDYYTYMGSLTTPPCSEDVLWMVMKQPLQISEDQLAIFARLYPRNSRPIQRANDRLIKESR
jgi:carbonic anhydrase